MSDEEEESDEDEEDEEEEELDDDDEEPLVELADSELVLRICSRINNTTKLETHLSKTW